MSEAGAPAAVSNAGSSARPMGAKIIVNRRRQDGNPVLKYVRNVRYEWGDIGADFEAGPVCGIIYLAHKYHRMHPNYVHGRLSGQAENKYASKVLLVLCNVEEPRHHLREINILCYRLGWTLILCYSVEEAGEYLENLRLAEGRDPVFRQQDAVAKDERTQLLNFAIKLLTGARSITKTDAQRLLQNFGSLKCIAEASEETLALCAGLGPIKAKNLHQYLRTPFLS